MQHDRTNTVFTLAADLVNYTSRHLFLTGKAGTGKTTFLKYIKETTKKNTVIVAPTGVAAINAKVTMLTPSRTGTAWISRNMMVRRRGIW